MVHINGLERSSSNDVVVRNVPRYSVRQTEHRYLTAARRRVVLSIVQCRPRDDNHLSVSESHVDI